MRRLGGQLSRIQRHCTGRDFGVLALNLADEAAIQAVRLCEASG
jgi:hypothetical protein